MDDTLYIKICLKLVEEKLGWKGHESWTDQDYRRLSDMISEKTEIQISHNTLKRLYGKFKYKIKP